MLDDWCDHLVQEKRLIESFYVRNDILWRAAASLAMSGLAGRFKTSSSEQC